MSLKLISYSQSSGAGIFSEGDSLFLLEYPYSTPPAPLRADYPLARYHQNEDFTASGQAFENVEEIIGFLKKAYVSFQMRRMGIHSKKTLLDRILDNESDFMGEAAPVVLERLAPIRTFVAEVKSEGLEREWNDLEGSLVVIENAGDRASNHPKVQGQLAEVAELLVSYFRA